MKKPKIRAKDPKKTIKTLLSYMKGEMRRVFALWLLAIISTLIGLLAPALIGRAIDILTISKVNSPMTQFWWVVMVIAGVYLLDATLSFSQEWLMAGVSQRIVSHMRNLLFAKLQKLPLIFFDTKAHGELMSRFTNDLDQVSSAISQTVIQLMNAILVIAGALGMMMYLSPKLTLVSMVVLPLFYMLTKTITQHTSRYFKEQQAALGALNAHIEESISGIQVIKAFGREAETIEEFAQLNNRYREIGTRVLFISGFLMPFMNIINNIGFVSVAFAGGIMAYQGTITVGLITSFLTYTRQFSRPLVNLANIYNTLQAAIAGAERYFEILELEDDSRSNIEDRRPSRETNVQLEDSQEDIPEIEFDNVSFGYTEDQLILKEVSFVIKPGKRVALVGPTGAGKTTIVNLLCGFYTPTSGRIRLGGRDLASISPQELSRVIAIVLQDTYLFSGTIAENLRYADENASLKALTTATEFANAHHFIQNLKNGLDSHLTEGAGNLSQGQKQLLSIARAVLRPSQILVLDEATSNIDTMTERQLQKAISQWMKGRTSVVIAHRLSTIRESDEIFVIESGQITERGSHDQLIAREGSYFRLYQNSLGGTTDSSF